MRVLIIGANGTMKKAMQAELSSNHELVLAGRQSIWYNVFGR